MTLFGKDIYFLFSGCRGLAHKQDRHNCQFMINMKLYLSDLLKWRVHLSGSHIPLDSHMIWEPPAPEKQRISEDTRDAIMCNADKSSSTKIQELLRKSTVNSLSNSIPSKRKICRFVSSMKKRRKLRKYDKSKSSSDVNDAESNDQNEHGQVTCKSENTEKCIYNNAQGAADYSVVYEVIDQSGNSAYYHTESSAYSAAEVLQKFGQVTSTQTVADSPSIYMCSPSGQTGVEPQMETVHLQLQQAQQTPRDIDNEFTSLGDIGVLLTAAYQQK